MIRRLCLPSLAVLSLVSAAACSDAGGASRKGEVFDDAPVILISIDTLRSDRLPAYGYEKVETPAIDALAKDSILYERAYSHYPLTLPSHVSMMSGLLPPRHGVRDNVGYTFDAEKHPSLARLFKEAGYETAAMVSAYVLRGSTGMGKGFDTYDDRLAPKEGQSLDAVQRPGNEATRLATEWVRGRADRPFFLFLHLYEPHAPYLPPEPFKSRYPDPYDGEVAASDAYVGEFLAELKRLEIYDKAVIVLLSDHGEALGDHGGQTHGVFLYREALQVPLLVKLPGARHGGTRVPAPAGLVDVFDTLLAVAGLDVPKGGDGASLLELLAPGAPPRRVYAETFYPRIHFGWSDLASMIDGPHHYIEGPDPELYDVVEDPKELQNLFGAERRVVGTMRQALSTIDRTFEPPGEVDAETAKKLAALGYAAGGAGAQDDGPLPDPKSQLHVVQKMEASFHAFDHGDYQKAVQGFQELVDLNPRMTDVWSYLGLGLQRLGRHEDAVAAYEKAMELSGGAARTRYALNIASSLVSLGRLEDARAHADLARESDPRGTFDVLMQIAVARRDMREARAVLDAAAAAGSAGEELRRRYALGLVAAGRPVDALQELGDYAQSPDPTTRNALALALSTAGRPAEARQVLAETIAAHPDNVRAYELMGVAVMEMGNPAEAEPYLRQALARDERLPGAWTTLGVALYQLRRPAEAVAAWQRAVEIDPAQYESLFNIGLVARELGRRDESRRALQRFVATAPPERFGADIRKAQNLLQGAG